MVFDTNGVPIVPGNRVQATPRGQRSVVMDVERVDPILPGVWNVSGFEPGSGQHFSFKTGDMTIRYQNLVPITVVGYIEKEDGEYCVKSESNPDWSGGCYPSKEKAKKRLDQVEMFKHMNASQQDATFIGWQKNRAGEPAIPLYNVTKPGHPLLNSTVSDKTLRENGLEVPETPPPTRTAAADEPDESDEPIDEGPVEISPELAKEQEELLDTDFPGPERLNFTPQTERQEKLKQMWTARVNLPNFLPFVTDKIVDLMYGVWKQEYKGEIGADLVPWYEQHYEDLIERGIMD